MPSHPRKPDHPGIFIRENVIPPGMSVTEAAKRLGVGRPALSNLLNGNASLSFDMAARLAKEFGADQKNLLERQAKFDCHGRPEKERAKATHTSVPAFLTITARQIHDWAENNIEARHLLPVLLRKLVHSTGHELRQVDFPGYDNAERKGWDGMIETTATTPWIPEGKSCWEFGTSTNPSSKAENDYRARLESVSADERAECTFVFVTSRNWPGKTEWAKSKQATGNWKAVRVFDASDLEQWLEESIPAQMWLAEHLTIPVNTLETLDRCWQHWAQASEPKMVSSIFEPSVSAHRKRFTRWLNNPSERLFVVAADSREEALAFLACLFQDDIIESKWGDLAAVFKSAETLRTLAASSSRFIPIVYTDEVERELAAIYRRLHCIIVRPRNAVDSKPDVALDLLNHDAFEKALAEMGIKGADAQRLARDSGCSPTILRRLLSELDAIKRPRWAADERTAKSLIPMTLVGAWHTKSGGDREVLEFLSGKPYLEIEESVARLLRFDDCPVWSVGQYRGVASKIDALFAIKWQIIEKDLTNFFWLAQYVLSESDPALELSEDQRWAAAFYGKVREHSAALRKGICETLVLLSVHGNNLFQERLGIDVENHVSALIRGLLTPLSLDKLLSQSNDLTNYAEAAPDTFLNLLEEDLQQPQPVVLGLLKPTDSSPFASPTRSELLWALECLAWKHLRQVSLILAQLSRTVINDNWVNKPISSLQAIYRSWMPQTAASLTQRIKALEMLIKKFPDIGWQICIEQLASGIRSGTYSYRPRWSNDASGVGEPVTYEEMYECERKALDLALAWAPHDQKTLGDLVERLHAISENDHVRIWELIDAWADSKINEKAKAELRERIRMFTFTRRGRLRGLNETTKERARIAYEKLEPRDPVIRHSWLFAQHWVKPSEDEIEDGHFNYSEHNERTRKLRVAAMKAIWAERGFEGVTALLSLSNAPDTVGSSLGLIITEANARADFLRQCLAMTGDMERKIDFCMQGFLMSVDDEERGAILSAVAKGMDTDRNVRLFRHSPFEQNTWRLLDRYGKETQDRYWQEVFPYWNHHSEAELIEIIDRLLEAKRPHVAFHTVAIPLHWSQIETSRLKRLLRAAATLDAEPADWYRVDDYYISTALNSLDGRTGVSPDEMAELEFLYIDALEHSEHGIPNLERQISESPAIFVQALALAFKRKDDGQDPPEWRIEDPGHRKGLASAAYQLLGRIKQIPGTDQDGKINAEVLLAWVIEVRRLCTEYGRAEIGDQKIGELLSKAPFEEDGEWPCLPVCEIMERMSSQQIGRGFNIGVYNERGVHSRSIGAGGAQERELAAQYRGWAKLRAFDYPFVSNVLESIAVTYDREATQYDNETKIQKRLGYWTKLEN